MYFVFKIFIVIFTCQFCGYLSLNMSSGVGLVTGSGPLTLEVDMKVNHFVRDHFFDIIHKN